MEQPRTSGILLHISSLPGPFGIGDLGPSAYRFAEFLTRTEQRVWQVLPVGPVGLGNSPYSSPSTFAGNPLFISPELLVQEGLLTEDDLRDKPGFPEDHVDYERVIPYKRALLEKAFDRFRDAASANLVSDFEVFSEQHIDWLDDYALFMAIKEARNGESWTEWPLEIIKREPEALLRIRGKLEHRINVHKFWQFLFDRQWQALKSFCNQRAITIFGDLPIYVAHDSADVWGNQQLFFLNERGNPIVVAGVPPDYFSETGQRWGNPIYRWDKMREQGFAWWTQRLSRMFEMVDLLRLDHFRAFEAYWEIPAEEETAVNGEWIEGPGAPFFETIRERLGKLPIVAEDLGIITPGVRQLMKQFDFPGMAVLQFAFDSDVDSDYLPHNYQPNVIAYTGTHDNDTTVGWWHQRTNNHESEQMARANDFIRHYVHLDRYGEKDIHWAFMRVVAASVADNVIFPLQDVLGLGSDARMNTPGSPYENWTWRLRHEMLDEDVESQLRRQTQIYGRSSKRRIREFDLEG